MKSSLEKQFIWLLKAYKINSFVEEWRFAPPRRWKLDFADLDHKIAVELEGGVYTGGRHTTGKGFEADCEKYNAATVLGWRVLRYTRNNLYDFIDDYGKLTKRNLR